MGLIISRRIDQEFVLFASPEQIDAEVARRTADKTTITVKKPRAPAKKKVVPATGHQTALT